MPTLPALLALLLPCRGSLRARPWLRALCMLVLALLGTAGAAHAQTFSFREYDQADGLQGDVDQRHPRRPQRRGLGGHRNRAAPLRARSLRPGRCRARPRCPLHPCTDPGPRRAAVGGHRQRRVRPHRRALRAGAIQRQADPCRCRQRDRRLPQRCGGGERQHAAGADACRGHRLAGAAIAVARRRWHGAAAAPRLAGRWQRFVGGLRGNRVPAGCARHAGGGALGRGRRAGQTLAGDLSRPCRPAVVAWRWPDRLARARRGAFPFASVHRASHLQHAVGRHHHGGRPARPAADTCRPWSGALAG